MGDDGQTRIHKDIQRRLDELKFVNRKMSYSKRVELLLNFYEKHQKEFKTWIKKQEKKN